MARLGKTLKPGGPGCAGVGACAAAESRPLRTHRLRPTSSAAWKITAARIPCCGCGRESNGWWNSYVRRSGDRRGFFRPLHRDARMRGRMLCRFRDSRVTQACICSPVALMTNPELQEAPDTMKDSAFGSFMIICADDFGYSKDINQAVIAPAQHGCVTAASRAAPSANVPRRRTPLARSSSPGNCQKTRWVAGLPHFCTLRRLELSTIRAEVCCSFRPR